MSVLIENSGALFEKVRTNVKQLKGKAKDLFGNKNVKNRTWQFLSQTATDYPGANDNFIQLNEIKWKTYYECLKEQLEQYGTELYSIPEAAQGFEGGSIK